MPEGVQCTVTRNDGFQYNVTMTAQSASEYHGTTQGNGYGGPSWTYDCNIDKL